MQHLSARGGGARGDPSHAQNFYLIQEDKNECLWNWGIATVDV